MSHLSHLYVPHNRMYEDKDTGGGGGTGIEDGTNDIWDIWVLLQNKLVASFLGARMQNIKNVVEATMKGADSEHFSGGNK